jgi:hypothetical protein
MASFRYKNAGGSWTDVPSYAFAGTYENGVVLTYPEATQYDGVGKQCAAIGKPSIVIKSSLMTASGLSFWESFFSSSIATTASISLTAFNPRLLTAGSLAWTSCSGWMSRPKFSRVKLDDVQLRSGCTNTWYYTVEIHVDNCVVVS